MALCVALGVTNVLNAWAALQTRPSVGSWALVVYHALYIVNLGGLGLLMALRCGTGGERSSRGHASVRTALMPSPGTLVVQAGHL